jgi:hypothetical protein
VLEQESVTGNPRPAGLPAWLPACCPPHLSIRLWLYVLVVRLVLFCQNWLAAAAFYFCPRCLPTDLPPALTVISRRLPAGAAGGADCQRGAAGAGH